MGKCGAPLPLLSNEEPYFLFDTSTEVQKQTVPVNAP
jgi:hypothetical protein